jgi:hypothetical protein
MPGGIQLAFYAGPTVLAPAPLELANAFRSAQVTSTDEGQDGFQVTFAAGRAANEQDYTQQDYTPLKNSLLKPFNRLAMTVTFGSSLQRVLIDGIITNQQVGVSQDPGKSTLTVTGEDVSVMMSMQEKVQPFPQSSDDVIVTQIIGNYGQWGLNPSVTSPPTRNVPAKRDKTPIYRGTDLAYVQDLARKYDYVFYIEPTSTLGQNTAYWGPHPNLNRTGSQQNPLTVGMGSSANVTSISFQYDALKPYFVSGKITDQRTNKSSNVQVSRSLLLPLSKNPAWQANQPNVRQKLPNEFGEDNSEAQTKAQAETDKSIDAITASGQLDALAYGDVLRARNLVGLRGCGYSYDGVYYVKSVTHIVKPGDYKQSFTLTREGLGSIGPTVTAS